MSSFAATTRQFRRYFFEIPIRQATVFIEEKEDEGYAYHALESGPGGYSPTDGQLWVAVFHLSRELVIDEERRRLQHLSKVLPEHLRTRGTRTGFQPPVYGPDSLSGVEASSDSG